MPEPLKVARSLREEAKYIRRHTSAMHDLSAPLGVLFDGVPFKLNQLTQTYLLDEACRLESDALKLETLYTEGRR